ncbi:MAG: glycoside hydrolase family 57 protein [Leptospiraceae bacterium]|nr:glycoside hydrolase family 57 protein [Leptospiraceae bacterium]MDW8305884.1 glycoside hydrolase family 57 protein [Leptospiraceae bacterium]
MKKIYLCFLWHQHQPFYKDTLNHTYRMPWVLMHSWKDYYDMLYLVLKNEIKATFNFVPSLAYQIQDYTQNPLMDELFAILQMSPRDLDDEKLRRLFLYAFDTTDHRKIKKHSRYHSLLMRRQAGNPFSEMDILDLQMLLMLQWFGEASFLEDKRLELLRQKMGGFTPEDKEYVLNAGKKILARIIPAHQEAFVQNKIEMTTSPFFHPILPLLDSFLNARMSVPNLPLPSVEANMQDDVEKQIAFGKQYMESLLGKEIRGFWPSEGAVSASIMPAFAKYNIRYIATDSGILINSLRLSNKSYDKKDLYHPYFYSTPHGEVALFFRDTELSDLIGFTYAHWDYEKAVEDFIERLRQISALFLHNEETPVVSVILDGENAWEHYPQNGYPFLNHLYKSIKENPWIETLTFSEVLEKHKTKRVLDKLHSGSWIYANLNTWIGHREKNQAWEYLVAAKKCFMEKSQNAKSQTLELDKASFELYAAEGSDWFWWYGDDFFSHFAEDFDALFRLHLRNVYTLLGEEVPPYLHRSIRARHRGGLLRHPANFLRPRLTGELSGFFDWLGAGKFNLTFDASTMQLSHRQLRYLLYGPGFHENIYGVYFCLMGKFPQDQGEILQMELMDGIYAKIVWDLKHRILVSTENISPAELKIVQKDNLQWFLPVKPEENHLEIQFKILDKGKLVEVAPLYSAAKLPIKLTPTQDWVV